MSTKDPKKFNDAYIGGLMKSCPLGKDLIKRDPSQRGFAVRVRKGKTGTSAVFLHVYDFKTERRKDHLGTYIPGQSTLAKANAKYHEAKLLLAQGIDPQAELKKIEEASGRVEAEKKRQITIASLAKRYMLEHSKPEKKSWREDQRIFDKDVIPALGERIAIDIKRADVILLLDAITARSAARSRSLPVQAGTGGVIKKPGGVMANRTRALLHHLYEHAMDEAWIPDAENPVTRVRKRAKESSRERALSPEEVASFWKKEGFETISQGVEYALKLTLALGQRSGEVVRIQWKEIVGDWVTIRVTKNSSDQRAFLTPLAKELLAELAANALSSEWVFPSAFEGSVKPHLLQSSLGHAAKKLQPMPSPVGRWTPHDLRRTVITNLGRLGAGDEAQRFTLNHKSTKLERTYDVHHYDEAKIKAGMLWDEELRRQIDLAS